MAAWVVCLLCALIVIKPQEFIPELAEVPVLHLTLGVAVLCIALDIARMKLRPAAPPQLRCVIVFFAWTLLVTAIQRYDVIEERLAHLLVLFNVFLAIAIACASSNGLRALATTIVGCTSFVTCVAVVQGVQPTQCMLIAAEDGSSSALDPDGRPCEVRGDCYVNPPVSGGEYRCERLGPLGTVSSGGRICFRGTLADPNELSLVVGMAIPFAIALVERRDRRRTRDYGGPDRRPGRSTPEARCSATARGGRRSTLESFWRSGFVVVTIAGTAVVIVMTRSRTGLLVFLVVVGFSAARWRGALALFTACVFGPPMLFLGGRSGTEADQSKEERVNLLREGLEMIVRSKGLGVGAGGFVDESSAGLTAHNAYILASAETGLLGACLFGLVLYTSLKVPFCIWRGDYQLDATVSRLAPAVFVSLCGALVGISFLSWTFKDVLYMVLGASAALYGAARSQDPRFSVRISWKETALVCVGVFGLLAALWLMLRLGIAG